MTAPHRTAPRLTRVVLVTALALVTTATTATAAGADKPARGCTRSYVEVTRGELQARFPGRADFDETFASIDKNGDDIVCAKQTPGLYNTVDNTSNDEQSSATG